MYKKDQNSEENFWISYADLMAGLLFVFILVIGAIVIKYAVTQNILAQEKKALSSSEEQKSKLFQDLENSKNQLILKASEIEKLKAMLLDIEVKYKDEETKNQSLAGELNEKTNVITLRDEELKLLAEKLLVQTQAHQKLVEEFDIAKLKIKTLTGLKLNVIAKLKEKLGNSIQIDEKNGAIKFSSNILFDQASSVLKEDSKKELKNTLKKYLSTLLEDKEIRKNIESITIEGHTNSDGTYLSNLALSQQRAQAVMQFLYDSNIIDRKLISKYINSSGRSDSDLILTKNGAEDKDASRRIEIKFNLKNEDAMKEIQKYLGEKVENSK